MDWKEIEEKYQRLQAEGKTDEEATEMLKDEIDAFAKECVEHPEKMTGVMPGFGDAIKSNPVLADLLFFLFFRPSGGWG